jgi:hypothetical protein
MTLGGYLNRWRLELRGTNKDTLPFEVECCELRALSESVGPGNGGSSSRAGDPTLGSLVRWSYVERFSRISVPDLFRDLRVLLANDASKSVTLHPTRQRAGE